MATSERFKAVFIILFFLVSKPVKGEGEEGDLSELPNPDAEKEDYESKMMVLEFPYDKNNSNTYASTTVIAQEDILNLTLCFNFAVNALKSAKEDKIQLLQLHDSDGQILAEVLFRVTFHGTTLSFVDSQGRRIDFEGPQFALMVWVRSCFSLSNETVSAAINGVSFDEQPASYDAGNGNFTLYMGKNLTGAITQVNLFSQALSTKNMEEFTKTGKCVAEGNLFSWKAFTSETRDNKFGIKTNIYHGKTNDKFVAQIDGPFANQSRLNIFASDYDSSFDCMEQCKKIGGRNPSVRSLNELETLFGELQAFIPESFRESESLIPLWLSATQGKLSDNQLLSLADWPQGIEAEEDVWRDYYTGQQLDYYAKPWEEDASWLNDTGSICTTVYPFGWWDWKDRKFFYYPSTCINQLEPAWCPCHQKPWSERPPLLLRGLCSSSNLRTRDFSRGLWYNLYQLSSNFQNIFYVGGMSTRIDYDEQVSKWILRDIISNTSAESLAMKQTYVLGKQKWTIRNDNQRCQEEEDQGLQEYKTELKLSGCNQGFTFDYGGNMIILEDGEFTCNDGQCVIMQYRCDQLPHCNDKSDEKECSLLKLTEGYNKIVPPFSRNKSRSIIPVSVHVSLRLLTVMNLNEDENTIDFQFEIILEWRDYRISYSNLKTESFLNALTTNDIESIWLPLLIYTNTDQKKSTQLSWNNEYRTSVIVAREGNFTR